MIRGVHPDFVSKLAGSSIDPDLIVNIKAQERIDSVLYLAEVQKKARVIGSNKVEFKLLACQRSEHSWSAVSEELIAAPDDVPQNSGALVLVDLSASRQVQRYSDAGRQLVSILQNFSRLQEKFKTQEEEIEQWKQSLTYQSQELNRREMEMEGRQQQLQEMEEDFERLEQQRQEIHAAQEEVKNLKEEFERKTQELEGAWAHLHGEMRRFEEQQSESGGSAGLSFEQAAHIQEVVNRLSGAVLPTEDMREQVNVALELVAQQQSFMDQNWHELEQDKEQVHQRQGELEHQRQELENSWQAWHQAQATWIEAHSALKAQQAALGLKQKAVSSLTEEIQRQAELKKQVAQIAEASGVSSVGDKVDVEALEAMPLDQLQVTVQELRQEWEKNSRFVSSQEEELALQQQDIEKLKERIEQASEYDRLSLENELADEQESYRMLHQTLVGQRRNLHEREMILRKHEAVLARREGLPITDGQSQEIDLSPVFEQLKEAERRLNEELQGLEQEIAALQASIAEQEAQLNQRSSEQMTMLDGLKQRHHELSDQRLSLGEQLGKISTSQNVLESVQNSLNGFRHQLEAIANTTSRFQETSDYQLQSMSELQQIVQSLATDPSPQYAAS